MAESENKPGSNGAGAAAPASARSVVSPASAAGAEPKGDPRTALMVHAEGGLEAAAGDPAHDPRLDRLPMQLDVMVRVGALRVADLLSLTEGSVVETLHDHGQDIPLCCGETLLVWGEFEMVEQRLAVRITRLA